MKHNIFRAFSERSFVFLWIAEVFTQIGSNIYNFFLILVIFTLTHSNTAVAGVIISFTVPAIFFGVIAGIYVDKRDKRHVLLVSNIIRAVLIFFLMFFHTNIILIYVITILVSIATQFFIPAETPILPQLVKPEMLYSANALFGMAIYGTILVSYVIAGPLLLALGQVGTLLFLSIVFLLSSVFIYLIKPRKTPEKGEEISIAEITQLDFRKEVKHAIVLMTQTREISRSLFMLALSQILILIVAAITPGYASQVLHMRVEEFPFIFITPAALGMVIGGVVLINVFHEHPKNKMVVGGLLLSGIAMAVLPFASSIASHLIFLSTIHILVFIAFLLGIANALVFVPSNTILQEQTSDNSRGKIYGVLNSLVGVFSLLPILVVGGLSDLIGVGRVIMGIGISLIALGIIRSVSK